MGRRIRSLIWMAVCLCACNTVSTPDSAGITDSNDTLAAVDVSSDVINSAEDSDGSSGDGSASGCSQDADCVPDSPCELGLCNIDGTCRFVFQGGACTDDDPCTVDETCETDGCVGQLRDCDDGNVCTLDGCDPTTGECSSNPADGLCDDGNPCTEGDRCDAGECKPTGDVGCDDNNSCTSDTCSASSGACVNTPLNDAACDDGNFCTVGDACDAGFCIPGAEIPCDDDNGCTKDACEPDTGLCVATPNTEPCDDGNACTIEDSCEDGVCQPGFELNCSDGNVCTSDVCVSETATCINENITGICTDGNFCTVGDTCFAGSCLPGPPKFCQDGNPCTQETCDSTTGDCNSTPSPGECSDGNPCSIGDYCIAGGCVSGMPKVCSDQNPCTLDVCNTDGICEYLPQSGMDCNDFNPCTDADKCNLGECKGKPKNCDDGNPCTDGDSCLAGTCIPGAPLSCDDDNPCTKDACIQSEGGCYYTWEIAAPCTLEDNLCSKGICVEGLCSESGPVDCSDGDLCTIDDCEPETGCSNASLNCNAIACLSGTCESDSGCIYETSPAICDDGIACSLDFCVPGLGCQVEYPEGCCDSQAFFESFDSGLTTWEVYSSSTSVKWQVVENQRSISGNSSLYYGNSAVWNYDTGNTSNGGAVRSATVTIPESGDLSLRFYVWLDVEDVEDFDEVGLRVLPSGTVIWNKTNVPKFEEWYYVVVDLQAFAGEAIQFQFEVNTVDGVDNTTEGVYIDDIAVIGCGPDS